MSVMTARRRSGSGSSSSASLVSSAAKNGTTGTGNKQGDAVHNGGGEITPTMAASTVKATTTPKSSGCCSGQHRRHWIIRCLVLVILLTLVQYGYQRAVLYEEEQRQMPFGMTNQRGRVWHHTKWQKGGTVQFPNKQQNNEIMKRNEETNKQIFNANHTITLDDLKDLDELAALNLPEQSWDEAAADRGPLLEILNRAGLQVDVHVLQRLPTWTQVVEMFGDKPVIVGLDRCAEFRRAVPAQERYVGVAGQMNTGTNALSKYMQRNLWIKENPIERGVLWTVPWYKHGWASLRYRYKYRPPDNHNTVMAVATIREPYSWMQSMCESPYTMEWNKSKTHCPNLVENNASTPIRVTWKQYVRTWPSMAELWSSWYREYYDHPDMPRLLIRFEDLLFHTEAVLDQIRECVGAEWQHDSFQYQTAPAKTHPYFARYKPPSSLISAMIKYGWNNRPRRVGTMTDTDLAYAHRTIDAELAEQIFRYAPAPPIL